MHTHQKPEPDEKSLSVFFPYHATVSDDTRDQALVWCAHNLGPVAAIITDSEYLLAPDRRWLLRGNTFYFRLLRDQLAFSGEL